MLLFGKRPGWLLMVTSVPSQVPSCLFYITDKATGLRFLVDNGAEVSVIPLSVSNRNHHKSNHTLHLQAINNTSIATYGNRSVQINSLTPDNFRWISDLVRVSTK